MYTSNSHEYFNINNIQSAHYYSPISNYYRQHKAQLYKNIGQFMMSTYCSGNLYLYHHHYRYFGELLFQDKSSYNNYNILPELYELKQLEALLFKSYYNDTSYYFLPDTQLLSTPGNYIKNQDNNILAIQTLIKYYPQISSYTYLVNKYPQISVETVKGNYQSLVENIGMNINSFNNLHIVNNTLNRSQYQNLKLSNIYTDNQTNIKGNTGIFSKMFNNKFN